MPLDQQSVLPTVRGVPWWGAVLIATALTAVGAIMDAKNHGNLGAVFNFCLLVGCCLAALAVRRRALFTAAAQPPLIAFCVGVLALYSLNAGNASGLKSLVLKVLLPIAANFPWMAVTFVVTLVLVLLRWVLTRPEGWNAKLRGGKNNKPPAKRRASTSTREKGARTSGARGDGDKAARTRRTETATSSSSRAATTRTSSSRGASGATSTSSSTRTARKKDAEARSTASKSRASASVVGAAATADDDSGRARPRRARAGDAARKTTESSEAPRRRAGDAGRTTARPVPVTSEETTRIPADQTDRPRPRARSAAADLDPYESGAAAAYQSTRSRNRS
ncbi:DUF6542 domain-containing protein [Gordonia polyisoprenivorans]|uniref:DUF6542 domain-containing protein n=1 Tax=Gordonia polyisoprenivorans TaxID=84595 RepID=UPI0030D23A9A